MNFEQRQLVPEQICIPSFGRQSAFRERTNSQSSTGSSMMRRDPPRRTLLDTFVERDENYWQNRIDLKIDIPFTDHSHIIGRQGKNTQAVMRRTGCHIHFPDSNKNRDNDKSNQVMIAGGLCAVEDARHSIRALAPLAIIFNIDAQHLLPGVALDILIRDPSLEQTLGFPTLSVAVRTQRSSRSPFCMVRGACGDEAQVVLCIQKFISLYIVPNASIKYQISMDILPAQQHSIKGFNGCLLDVISQSTSATIRSPAEEDAARGASTFLLQGDLPAVLTARRYLIALLPVSLQFNTSQRIELDFQRLYHDTNIRVDVRERIQPAHVQKKETQSQVTATTSEFRISALYQLRQRMCQLNESDVPQVTDYAFITPQMVQKITQLQEASSVPTLAPLFAPPATPIQYPHPSRSTPIMSWGPDVVNHRSFMPMPVSFSQLLAVAPPQWAMQPQPYYYPMPAQFVPTGPPASINSTFNNVVSENVTMESIIPDKENVQPTSALTADHIGKLVEEALKEDELNVPCNERSYDFMRILAQKQMANPGTGLRQPNLEFAGYGFSISTPNNLMKLKETVNYGGDGSSREKDVPNDDDTTTPTSSTTPSKMSYGKPTPLAVKSDIVDRVVPEDQEVHHSRQMPEADSPPEMPADFAPAAPILNRFAQSSAAEQLGPLLKSAQEAFKASRLYSGQSHVDNPLKNLQLRSVLAAFHLESIYSLLEENEVDLEALMCMEEADFITIGASIGNRAKLRALQYQLRQLTANAESAATKYGVNRMNY